MKQRFILIALLWLLAGAGAAQAQQVRDTLVMDYRAVDRAIDLKRAAYGVNDVLVVLDIDNTLLTSDADLGGDFWYQWQSGELEVKPTAAQKLSSACLFSEAIPLLYELNTMSLTDTLLPAYIKKWQDAGVTVMALTSRSPACRPATERELLRNGIDLSRHPLKTIAGDAMSFSYALGGRELSYQNGIFMTSGMNKGDMLVHILGRAGRSFKSILFVDDTRKNIDNVKSRYLTLPNADALLFYYTPIATKRRQANGGVLITPAQANRMAADWEALNRTLNTLFPQRTAKCRCAGGS